MVRTQWRMSMNGPTGMDYGVVYHRMDRLGLSPEQYLNMEHDIQVLEAAALNEMRKEK